MQEAINEYITDKKNVSPADLVNDLLLRFYPVSDLVLDASKYFTTIIKSKDFCVESNILVKYGILSEHKNGIPRSADVLRLLQQYNRVENVDFNVRNVAHIRKVRGVVPIEYIMTPKTFFLCLTRSKNSCQYAEYYFHVLELYDYYEDYYTKMYKETIVEKEQVIDDQKHAIVEKDTSISRLEQRISDMMLNMEQDRIITNQREIRMEQRHSELLSEHARTQSTLDKIVRKLDDRAVPPTSEELTERFVLMKKGSEFYVIRSQVRNIGKVMRSKELLGYSKVEDLDSETIPNSTYFWNVIKEELIKERKIRTKYNSFTLNNLSEHDLVDTIKEVFKSRNEIN
jgi:hypothetical protein